MPRKFIICFSIFILFGDAGFSQGHPNLILTSTGVEMIKGNLDQAPLFRDCLEAVKMEVDAEISAGIDVPIPKDMAGGYTHERHKKNFFILQKAGNLFQITGSEVYAQYISDMLFAYAELYPTLDLHPTNRSYATGKIFWQCLNDANWLVYVSQAYDCIYDWLSPEDREVLEQDLFRPFADFLSIENPQFFNRIHNHSTWGNAAVGMIGLVMGDEELVNRALYGLDIASNNLGDRDNDNGLIRQDGQKMAGFLAQLDYSFSPDGYFTEGPYYLRYAIYPFILFSKALSNGYPDLNIMDYRDAILEKAIFSLLYQTDPNGQFFPINDAQKGMSWQAREVVTALDIAYATFGQDPSLLSIAKIQNRVLLDNSGFMVARDIQLGLTEVFQRPSISYQDGADGKEGGIGILRTPARSGGELCVLMKYSAQGMGHGHFDKLSYSFYDESGEIIQDYGAARWVNIDQKGGGRYLPENQSWAKQSIAHNTLTINEVSHYNGDIRIGEQHHPDAWFFVDEENDFQAISAIDTSAYPGQSMHRTLILLESDELIKPMLVDVFRVTGTSESQFDLPVWFQGHLLDVDFEYEMDPQLRNPLGTGHGYQHIWKEASGNTMDNNAMITWFTGERFYTLRTVVDATDELILGRLGANDPNFNLRPDPVFMVRRKGVETVFASVVESHGVYDPAAEIPLNPFGQVEKISILYNSDAYTLLEVEGAGKLVWHIMIANADNNSERKHEIDLGSKQYSWQGPISVVYTKAEDQ